MPFRKIDSWLDNDHFASIIQPMPVQSIKYNGQLNFGGFVPGDETAQRFPIKFYYSSIQTHSVLIGLSILITTFSSNNYSCSIE